MTIAALLLPLALLQAQPTITQPTIVQDSRFQHCIERIDADAEAAYEDAMQWASEGHTVNAYRCAAMALVGQNKFDEGAQRFESLATAINPDQPELKAELFSQAGNTWLLAREPAQARSDFTRAITTVQSEPDNLPDLLIDRSRAYAMEGDYRHAEEDLSHALDIRPQDPLALRLRASSRMHQSSFDLAEADAQAAVTLQPTNIDALVMLGHTREAKRTGQPVMEQ